MMSGTVFRACSMAPLTVLLEPDGVTGLLQKVRLQLADVRIAIDDQDDRLTLSSWLKHVRSLH